MKRLLVVDDDPQTMSRLRVMLAEISTMWSVEGVATPDDAMATLKVQAFDVVLANIHLGGRGGIQLLSDVKVRCPHTVRIATCAAAHRTVIVRALEVAHQFLPKPPEAEDLKAVLLRTGLLQDRVMNESVRRLIAEIRTLPSLPSMYQELVTAMQSPQATVDTAAQIVAKDMAMTAKILQVVNSAYFSLRRTITSPAHAIALLGIDTVKSLAFGLELFAQFSRTGLPVSPDQLWKHGMAVGTGARAIALSAGVGPLAIEGAFIGGLVHDLGVLILAHSFPQQYADALRMADETRIPPWQAEQTLFGTTHAEVGGYLLGLWGLSDRVVDAATYHHHPMESPGTGSSVLSAVHAADVFDEERDPMLPPEQRTRLDMEYLAGCGLAEQATGWRDTTPHAA
jgi:HD-like signal output (HDOD) protein